MIEKKLSFEDYAKSISMIEDSFFEDIGTYANEIVNLFEDFLDKFYTSTKKNSLMCSFFVNFVLIKVNLFQNLQKE